MDKNFVQKLLEALRTRRHRPGLYRCPVCDRASPVVVQRACDSCMEEGAKLIEMVQTMSVSHADLARACARMARVIAISQSAHVPATCSCSLCTDARKARDEVFGPVWEKQP